MYNCFFSPGGGIGRHKGLKIPRRRLRAGSSPALGTTKIYFMNPNLSLKEKHK